jgi:hypothetical protein
MQAQFQFQNQKLLSFLPPITLELTHDNLKLHEAMFSCSSTPSDQLERIHFLLNQYIRHMNLVGASQIDIFQYQSRLDVCPYCEGAGCIVVETAAAKFREFEVTVWPYELQHDPFLRCCPPIDTDPAATCDLDDAECCTLSCR